MEELEEQLYVALGRLDGDQLYVIAGLVDGRTEREIAEELTASRGHTVSRNRVHRIKLTALAKLRREMEGHGAS